jgi:hypothetical protein
MADQTPPQSSPQAPPTPVPTVSQAVEAKVEETFSSIIKALWAKYGILFVLVGMGLLALKFGSIAMDVLGWSSKKDLQNAIKTDTQLKAQEDATNKQADALVREVTDLPKTEGKVDDDWDKKQGN